MKVLRGFQQISDLQLGTAATIGNFDGVHLGHQALLGKLRAEAHRLNLATLVLLFEPQPSEYFQGSQARARLSSFREKVDVLRQLGIDYVCCLKFNNTLASMAATMFAEHMIFQRLQAKYMLIGEDFRFGHQRVGDVSLLQKVGKAHGCEVECFNDFYINEQRVSSTEVRRALALSEFERARALLGRPYSMCGRVIHGDGRGRQWGIPTANLSVRRLTLALKGVFCVRVYREDKPALLGVANIGCRPTVDGHRNVLEVHLFDTDESFYGDMLRVCFMHKLRDEMRFESIERLVQQIHLDVAAAKQWFKQEGTP